MKGFSLIEITVVALIAGIVFLGAAPVLRGVLPGRRLESGARRLSAAVGRIYGEAVFTGRSHSLEVDIEEGSYKAFGEVPDSDPRVFHGAAGSLPEGVVFSDIDVAGRKYSGGYVRINFTRHGVVEPSVIRISDEDGRVLSLIIESYTGRVRIVDGYAREDFR